MKPQNLRLEIENLRQKVIELILKNPDRAALILAAWVNQKTESVQSQHSRK